MEISAIALASTTISELTDRARDIFQRVVEGYIDSGAPVGSKTLAADGTLNLSPASIRSVLADLEGLGLLAAPHTSAGRLPTDAGLRIFVDGMMRMAEPTREERERIEAGLAETGAVEQALTKASTLLSDLSGAAGMVMVPRNEPRLAQMRLVPLDATRALLERGFVLLPSGDQGRVLSLTPPLTIGREAAFEACDAIVECLTRADRARAGANEGLPDS